MAKGYITQAWLVLCLALVFGAALAGMQILVAERIAENKLKETLAQIPELVPGSEEGKERTIDGRLYYEAIKDGERVGWVIPASAVGFADKIEVLIGVDAKLTTITGLYVLDQKETPGLGDKIREASWRSQFNETATAPALEVVKTEPSADHHIRAITGATISSQTVCDIVNDTLVDVREPLNAAGE